MRYEMRDGRWFNWADRVDPERCQLCGYRGAAVAPNAAGVLTCSICDPNGWPDIPDHLEQEVEQARQKLGADQGDTAPALLPMSQILRIADRLRATHPRTILASHRSPTAQQLAIVMSAEIGELVTAETVARAATAAGYPVLPGTECTHIGATLQTENHLTVA